MRWFIASLVVVALICLGLWRSLGLLHFGVPGDPNDPRTAGMLAPDVLRQLLKGVSDSYLSRVQSKEMTDAQFQEQMAKTADQLLAQIDIDRIPKAKAWEYGEIFITARHWKDAERALRVAVQVAKGEDRRVNDSLRLARAEAQLGKIDEAITTARAVFNTPDEGAAPILLATLYEIVPAAQGKKHDAELAKLVEDAIACHMRTIVDPKSEGGMAFLAARSYHVGRAWDKVVELYEGAGKPDLAAAARVREQQASSGMAKA